MATIRRFEETVLEQFSRGVFFGTTHTYLGQEANAAGVISALGAEDIVFSNHRCHGHFLAYGGDLCALFAELMGRESGVCGGRGGSQHLQWRNFYSNGVQGGIVPVATGMALAEKYKGSLALAVVFIGDGTLGEGAVYESLNLAMLRQAPILFVLENNQIAQTTPVHYALAGSLGGRFEAFGITGLELDSSDVLEIRSAALELIKAIRSQGGPRYLILNTARFGPHSKGDDTRPVELIASLKTSRDPLVRMATRLDPELLAEIERTVAAQVQAAFHQALNDPLATLLGETIDPGLSSPKSEGETQAATKNPKQTVLESLNHGLRHAFEADQRVILLGEDILDPYGGAFKVSRGVSTAYPERTWSTPISEAGITGLAAGLALRGLRPVVEIMFGDFLTLTADQVINHIAKFSWMYSGGKSQEDQVSVPMVIRTPMGGRRGYGPTHSQTLEKIFLGTPGLRIVAPSGLATNQFDSPGALLGQAILDDPLPVLFIENKLQYLLLVHEISDLGDWELLSDLQVGEPQPGGETRGYPTYTLRLSGAPAAQISLAAYGYMVELACQAIKELAYTHEIFVELVAPSQLAPLPASDQPHLRDPLAPLYASLQRTGRLLAIEEGNLSFGWGAEILARSIEHLPLRSAGRVAALDLPIPAAGPLETAVLPAKEQIIKKCLELARVR
jgi:2-oxoisovalerate dehydrogenase E1 component